MKDVILVQYEMKYEPGLENICVVDNMKLANECVRKAKKDFPDLYTNGRFYFTKLCYVYE